MSMTKHLTIFMVSKFENGLRKRKPFTVSSKVAKYGAVKTFYCSY